MIDRCFDLSPVLTLLAVLFKVVADGLSTGVGPSDIRQSSDLASDYIYGKGRFYLKFRD